jgi:large conductance mechanosensitive channel
MNKQLNGFMDFIKEQGVVGLAVGLVLGGAVAKLVAQLVDSFINPVVGKIVGAAGPLAMRAKTVGGMEFKWGAFVAQLIDFLAVAAVVYFVASKLASKLDAKK